MDFVLKSIFVSSFSLSAGRRVGVRKVALYLHEQAGSRSRLVADTPRRWLVPCYGGSIGKFYLTDAGTELMIFFMVALSTRTQAHRLSVSKTQACVISEPLSMSAQGMVP